MAGRWGRSRRVAPIAQGLFWLALAFTLFMALNPHPPDLTNDAPDKLQHMAAFVALAVLAAIGFPRARLLTIGERLSFVGALIEVVQAIPALHRDCDILDWVADTIAIAGVLAVVHLARRRVARSQPPSFERVPAAEQRATPRLKACQPASVRVGEQVGRLHLLNVSSGGALCHMSVPPAEGSEAVVDFVVWKVNARVVWVTGRWFGIAFEREIGARLVGAMLQDWRLRAA